MEARWVELAKDMAKSARRARIVCAGSIAAFAIMAAQLWRVTQLTAEKSTLVVTCTIYNTVALAALSIVSGLLRRRLEEGRSCCIMVACLGKERTIWMAAGRGRRQQWDREGLIARLDELGPHLDFGEEMTMHLILASLLANLGTLL